MYRLVLGATILAFIPSSSFAWGDLAHKVICQLAFRLAHPETRTEIARLVQLESQYATFPDACTWADHPRKRGSEHFVNLPRTATRLNSNTCPQADKCVLTAVEADRAVLSSQASDERKLTALKFISHWVGDVHQPLHVSFEDDLGGNKVPIAGECRRNLHSAWDACLVSTAVGNDFTAAAIELESELNAAARTLWTRSSNPVDWANESFAITRAPETKYCVLQGPTCSCQWERSRSMTRMFGRTARLFGSSFQRRL